MSVYQRFEKHDLLEAYVHVRPRLEFASGTVGVSGTSNGWRGNVGVSSSISLYDGIRARTDVKSSDFAQSGITVYPLDPVDTHSIDKVIFVSGSYPSTGSVTFVKVRNSASLANSQVTSQDWWKEHFSPISLLFDYYNRYDHDYTTGSYDYYSLRMRPVFNNNAPAVLFSGSGLTSLSGAMTCEAYVKLLRSTGQDQTIQGQRNRWRFYVTGSTGQLAWTDYRTTVVSTTAVPSASWQQVAAVVSGGIVAFYLNNSRIGTGTYTGTLVSYNPLTAGQSLAVGGEMYVSGTVLTSRYGLDGFIFESRVWNVGKTITEMSSTFNTTILNYQADSTLLHYSKFNDGPRSSDHGWEMGSGSRDYASGLNGTFVNFSASFPYTYGPMWNPNDNPNFKTVKNLVAKNGVDMVKVVHIPSMFYGKQIATGSVRIQCNAYSGQGIRRVLLDDGFGGLYLSGSMTRDLSGESYTGPKWNKVGNVFYSEGLIVIRDPALLDMGEKFVNDVPVGEDLLQVSFAGSDRISTKVLMCRANQAELNYSNNPTSYYWDNRGTADPSDDIARPVREDGTTFITSIGIYDDERRLVAVAKLAQPIRKRTKDKIMIRLRLDI